MRFVFRAPISALLGLLLSVQSFAQAPAAPSTPPPAQPQAQAAPAPRQSKPQTRQVGTRVAVDPSKLWVDDGDTGKIQWSERDTETVRILGIDTPEIAHPRYDQPYAQSFGPEARAFAKGAFATATKIELLRSSTLDPYGRTLGYFFLNDKNYSVLVVRAHLAEESVSRYGDNGLPTEAAAVTAAAKDAGPVLFEPPGDFRKRMRDWTKWLQSTGAHTEN